MTIRSHSLKYRYGLSLAITLVAANLSQAVIPEPDAVIYGLVFHRFNEPLVTRQSGDLSLTAQVNGTNLAVTFLSPGTNVFLLRIPMDDGLQPRQPNTAKAGDRVRFLVQNNQTLTEFECVQSYTQSWNIPAGRAPVVMMDLSVESNVTGTPPDSNGDGIPDYWVNYFHLDPSVAGANQDADGDGVSNLAEFIAGTDPTNPTNKFTVSVTRNLSQPETMSLTFGPAFTDRTYSIWASDSPSGPWVEQQSFSPALSGPQTVDLPSSPTSSARFFRVSVRFTQPPS